MGAHDFMDGGVGRTCADAYREACDAATYQHGHDAYNGTISTTNGAREIPATELKGFNANARRDILGFLALNERDEVVEALAATSLKDARTRGVEWPYKQLRKYSAGRRAVIARLAPTFAGVVEKWGNCLAVELPRQKGSALPRGHRQYTFCGWAAS